MSTFPIDADRLQRLAATRGGRVALAGFEYQRAFALLRLVSMWVGKAVKGSTTEVPALVRYEWAEDIDELAADGRLTLWQCKLGDGWTAPTALAGLLAGFAPKWLWTPPADRARLNFRLVTNDPAYAALADLPGTLPSEAQVRARFLADLAVAPGDASDRAQWQAEADAVGHGVLFDALWAATRVLFVPARSAMPAPAPWPAEDEALSVLAKAHRLAPGAHLGLVVQALRGLLGVDPPPADAAQQVPRPSAPPLWLRPIDVADRLNAFLPLPAGLGVPVNLVDRPRVLAWQAQPPVDRYIARRPEWHDVVHGADQTIGFFERTVTDDLVARLRRALADSLSRSGRLRLQWLVGAPGAGKSTLALRAAARLVDDGACSVVDARHALGEDDDVPALVAELRRLAEGPRPLLLLLDDPRGVGSRWPALLQALSRGSPAVVVLAATPDFLLTRHQHELRDLAPLPPLLVDRPDKAERADLARLYPGLDPTLLAGDEDLLVLAMQAAADKPFDDIIRGQWRTLADGHAIADGTLARDLPWEVAAFWLVVFFHRAYAACPLSLLEGVLGARPDGADAAERLAQLPDANGWRIFQVEVPQGRFAYQGTLVRAMHARVAQRAWENRPARVWRVADAIAQASLRQPTMARRLAEALAAAHAHDPIAAKAVVDAVAQAWAQPEAAALETRYLCELHAVWTVSGVPVPPSLGDTLRAGTARRDAQSWLAALQLLHAELLGRPAKATLDLPYEELIDVASFSVAPNRAIKFANALKDRPALWQRFVQRLWQAFDAPSRWRLDNVLLIWLLTNGGADAVQRRRPALRGWLAGHPADSSVRGKYLAQLNSMGLRVSDADLRDVLDFLDRVPTDTGVRSALLSLLSVQGHPALPEVLDRSLLALGRETRSFQPASAALAAAATLGPEHLPLMVRWLDWAAEVLDDFAGNRAAQSVATSLAKLIARAERHAAAWTCRPDDRAAAEAAVRRIRAARTAWEAAISMAQTRDR